VGDYNELERVLTSELGSREDYVREFGDTPFGLLVRKIAKLDHDAAMQAFSDFVVWSTNHFYFNEELFSCLLLSSL